MERQTLIAELVGDAYPAAVTLESGYIRRNWIARTEDALPSEADLTTVGGLLETDAATSIKAAYSEAATTEAVEQACPSVRLIRLDDHHLIVRIEFARPQATVGDAAVISQWGVLQALDRRLRLDELQGLPCAYWFPLRAGRETDTK